MLLHELVRKEIPSESGIYKIRHRIDGKFKPICRAANTDAGGIIYIGKSQNLRDRIWTFRKVVFTDSEITKGHVAANRYVRVNAIHKAFPPDRLWIEWKRMDDCELAEAKALMAYLRRYAELPPLNYGAPYNSLAKELGMPHVIPLP